MIDGKTLEHVLRTPTEPLLAQLGSLCGSVVICRASPSQKAAIVKMMTEFEVHTPAALLVLLLLLLPLMLLLFLLLQSFLPQFMIYGTCCGLPQTLYAVAAIRAVVASACPGVLQQIDAGLQDM